MRSQRTPLEIRDRFRKNESDNLFYDFTEDHRIDYLWSDNELEAVMAQHFSRNSYERVHIQSLIQKGYLHVLRCARRENASVSEKTRLLKHIEKSINDDSASKNDVLAYLHSFCYAIDYFSEDEKEKTKKQSRIRSLVCFAAVICVTFILGLTIKALMDPEAFFPVTHMYVYDFWGKQKLIDVAYQYNKLKRISFYDNQGNMKTELHDWNDWGTDDLTVHEAATESAGERNIFFSDGSAVPIMITEKKGEGSNLSVYYKPNGKIRYTEESDHTKLKDGFRYVYYSEDGTDINVRFWNGKETQYYSSSALEPLYSYGWDRVDGENEDNYQIIYHDGKGDTIYTNDVGCIRKENSSLRIIKDTLENGTMLNYFAMFYDRASREYDYILFPSENLFTAHPESEKEYVDGRLVKESWGPMPEYKLGYYEYIYEQNMLTSIREYIVPFAHEETIYQYDTVPVYRCEYKINAQGHISEIIPHDPHYEPYYFNIVYGDNSEIMKVSVYYNHPYYPSEEREFYYSYSCNYINGSLESIKIEDQEGIPRVILLRDTEGEIIDYKVIETQPQ